MEFRYRNLIYRKHPKYDPDIETNFAFFHDRYTVYSDNKFIAPSDPDELLQIAKA